MRLKSDSHDAQDDNTSVSSFSTTRSKRRSIHGPLTGWEQFIYYVIFGSYAVLNSLDMILSGFLLFFSVMLSNRLGHNLAALPNYLMWLIWTYNVLGSSILVEVFLSISALAFVTCRPVSYIPQYMALVIAAVAFLTGIGAFVLESLVFNYLYNNIPEYSISERDMDTLHTYYKCAAALALAVVPTLQGLRYVVSTQFTSTTERVDGEFDELLDEHDQQLEERLQLAQEARKERYNNIRGYYQTKYDTL